MELEGQEEKSPSQLSGGQQQRVALARALVIRPKVLLFDEPLSNLDAQLRVRVRGELREVQNRLGITSVYVTHDQEEAFSIADLVAIMNQGKLTQLGSPIDLYRRPVDRFVAEFVGLSNVVSAELVQSNVEGADVRVLGQVIHSQQPPANPNAAISAVLRPEAIKITGAGKGESPLECARWHTSDPSYATRWQSRGMEPSFWSIFSNPDAEEFYEEGAAVSIELPKEVPALLS